jgi:hypothetical protein
MSQTFDALEQIRKLRAQIKDLRARPNLAPALAEALAALDRKAAALSEGEAAQRPPSGAPPSTAPANAAGAQPAPQNLTQLHTSLATLYEVLQQADAAPTTQAVAAAADLQRKLREAMPGWDELKMKEVESVNAQLRAAGLPTLTL